MVQQPTLWHLRAHLLVCKIAARRAWYFHCIFNTISFFFINSCHCLRSFNWNFFFNFFFNIFSNSLFSYFNII